MNALREGLPPLPARIAALPVDARGFPVPFFVALVNGVPDHRVMDATKLPRALKEHLCWICGQKLGAYKTFCIGPMCCITRTISEPPSHLECVRFSAIACPFLSRPHAKRRTIGLPEQAQDPAGVGLKRNPGAVCLWTTKTFRAYNNRSPDGLNGNEGVLFRLGEPTSLEWYAEGRLATREEVDESVRTGLPLLQQAAVEDDEYNGRLPAAAVLNFARLRKTAVDELAERIAGFAAMLDCVLPR